jgi:hypothetical protein
LLLPVHRDVLEQVVERGGEEILVASGLLRSIEGSGSKLDDLVYVAWRDMVHRGEVRDAGCAN